MRTHKPTTKSAAKSKSKKTEKKTAATSAKSGKKAAAHRPGRPSAAVSDERQIFDYVRANKAARAEEIRDSLGLASDRVSYLLKKLRNQGLIEGQGVTRGTTYATVRHARPPA